MELTPLEKIPFDWNPNESMGVYNPTTKDFTVPYGGVPTTLASGKYEIWPAPKAHHVAKHLAQSIVVNKQVELLQEQFEGLDTEGREKWKVNTQILYSRKDIDAIKTQLLFNAKEQPPVEMKVPETKFDAQLAGVKAKKRGRKAKTESEE